MILCYDDNTLLTVLKILIEEDGVSFVCGEKTLKVFGKPKKGIDLAELKKFIHTLLSWDDKFMTIDYIKERMSVYFLIDKIEWIDSKVNSNLINKENKQKGEEGMLNTKELKEKFISEVNVGIDLMSGRLGILSNEGLLVLNDNNDLLSVPFYKELRLPAIRINDFSLLKKGTIVELNGELAFFIERKDNKLVVLKQDGSLQEIVVKKDLLLQEGIKAVVFDLNNFNPFMLLLLDKEDGFKDSKDLLLMLMLANQFNNSQQNGNLMPFFFYKDLVKNKE